MYGFETQLVDTIVRFLLGLLGLILLEAAAGVFLGLCVYNDACYRGDSNPVLWGVLSGFFNIVALVYIIVQLSSKNKTAFCVQCRAPIPQGYTVCPACGMPLFLRGKSVSAERMEGFRRRRKLFLILFIVFFAVALILGVLVIVDYITNIFQTVTSFGNYWETAL